MSQHEGREERGRADADPTVSATELLDIVRRLPDVVFRCEKRDDGAIYWTLSEGRLAQELHLTTQEVADRPMHELFPGPGSAGMRAQFERAFGGTPTDFVDKMGQRSFKHCLQPLVGDDGQVTAVVGFIAEATEAEEARQRIEALNAELVERLLELRRANDALESFGYTVTHDLRGPLSAILLQCELGRMEAAGGSAIKALGRIDSAARRMSELIDDLLDLSRAGRAELAHEAVDLSAMAHDIMRELRAAAPGRALAWHAADGLVAMGDPGLLRQVMTNLLANAWKYSRERGESRIFFGAEGDGEGRRYFVKDNGIGFPPEEASRLFAPFERLTNADGFEGTGVGLATVRRIVERHGGRVWAEGVPDDGATFWFTLPIGER